MYLLCLVDEIFLINEPYILLIIGFTKSMIAILNSLPRFDPTIWDHPEIFNPARFFNQAKGELKEALAKYSLSSFSEGKRKCPAHKITEFMMKTFIAHLTLHYDFTLRKENSQNEKNNKACRIRLDAASKVFTEEKRKLPIFIK